MTYQVLARKWRPRSFSEMAGQSHVLKTLINSLDHNRLHHAYLFTGTRGVGKTTIARILAKCLNCETGVTSTPCGECSACKAIDQGRFIDLIEVDAASRTKVEDTRELLDNVQYAPTTGRYKVYLIDEVHMLSGHSFNALLKTLEEPPPHVKFLLATTDPQKLPVTVLSRCLQFNLKNLSPEQIVEHLAHILKAEDIAYEEPALWQLGRAARGSVRDSLTLLDQAIAYCDGQINEHDVSALLGTIDQAIVHHLVDALKNGDGAEVLKVIQNAAEHAPDFGAVLEELLSYLHRVAIAQVVPAGIDNSQGDRSSILAHAQALPAEVVQLYYQIGLKGREDLPLSLDARSGLEMCLLRMLAFTPDGIPNSPTVPLPLNKEPLNKEPGKTETGKTDENESGAEVKKKPESPVTLSPATAAVNEAMSVPQGPGMSSLHVLRVAAATQAEPDQVAIADIADRTEELTAQPEPEQTLATGTKAEPAPQYTKLSATEPKLSLADLTQEDWISLYYQLNLSGITGNMAANSLLESVEGNQFRLLIDDTQAAFLNEEHQRRIEQALCRYFDEAVTLTVIARPLTDHPRETPARWRRRQDAERLERARQSFEKDEAVQDIINRFSGVIVPESIEPLTPRNY